ncbi:uncharacterized protein LOC123318874 isoform X2 [Coccinella septempunctata]|nr:uncharacterized protein LOC123318874 isoform X2 [Coccinella septempunctata]XP_044761580.1 uncharacterized protein LOC123318874 isoform X2 [Coccinella septempunctata]
MSRDEYFGKCTALLNDTHTYQTLESDPTVRIQNKNNRFVKILLNKDLISETVAEKLTCNNGIFPKMYFLPKIHKTGIPLRPVLSFVGSPIYQLSKFVADLLKPIFVKDEHYVRNSFDFFNSINGTKLPPDYILVSLDVVSLYTNTPTDLALQIIEESWNVVSDPSPDFDFNTFKLVYNFLIASSYFCFSGQFYHQIFGFGMGNCVSQICCDIVMVKLQNSCLSRLPFWVPIFKRYVDDIFIAIPVNTEQLVLDTFNSFHPKLQFTLELESNNALNFLDMRVERVDENVLYVDWYQKPTFSGRYIGFHSHHAMIHKVNIIRNLKFRALNLSDCRFHEKNLKKIRSILLGNSYPASLIDRILREPPKLPPPQDITSKEPPNAVPSYHRLIYIKGLSERLSKIIKKEDVRLSFKSSNTLGRHFFSIIKNPTPTFLNSNVVYKIDCLNCSQVYIGQTGRYLKSRIQEHIRSVRLPISNPKTALAEHCVNAGHIFNFEDVRILNRESYLSNRLIYEMLQISVHDSVNSRSDIQQLSRFYYSLLKMKMNQLTRGGR